MVNKKVPVGVLKDIFPEMPEYLKHIRELCGGDRVFYSRYLDDPVFSSLVDIHETVTRAILAYHKLESGQVVVSGANAPLEKLLKIYMSRLEAHVRNMKVK